MHVNESAAASTIDEAAAELSRVLYRGLMILPHDFIIQGDDSRHYPIPPHPITTQCNSPQFLVFTPFFPGSTLKRSPSTFNVIVFCERFFSP